MKIALNSCVVLVAVAVLAFGCGDQGGGGAGTGGAAGSGGSAGSRGIAGSGGSIGNFGFLRGGEGSDLTLRHPDGTEESIGGEVIFGWINGQLLEGNYSKQLRIGTDIGSMDLRMSFPGDAPPTGLIEGLHQLRGTRLLLEQTQTLDGVQVEAFFQSSDPPFDGLTNATGTVEIFLDVNAGLDVYDIAGEIDASINGVDGAYGLNGFFWARTIDP
jgi:hypothetical protein